MPSRTRLEQDKQVRQSRVFTDTKPAGSALETGAVHLEDDLNSVRSQLKRAIFDDGAGNWYADIPTVNGKKRGIFDLNTGLDALEVKKALRRVALFTDFTVPGGQNWKLLTASALQTPPAPAAVSVLTDGAVVAKSGLSGGLFNSFESIVVAGPNAVNVKNLLFVREAAKGFSLASAGRLILGLLQYEGTGVDGAAFNDTSGGNRAKISFVRLNPGLDGLEPCPASDIQGKTVNYAFVRRVQFDGLAETDWLNETPFIQPPDGVSTYDFLLDCDPDSVNNTNTLTRLSGKLANETWVNDITLKIIKKTDYIRSPLVTGQVASEVVKVYADDGTTVVAQKTVTYTRLSGSTVSIQTTRDI